MQARRMSTQLSSALQAESPAVWQWSRAKMQLKLAPGGELSKVRKLIKTVIDVNNYIQSPDLPFIVLSNVAAKIAFI